MSDMPRPPSLDRVTNALHKQIAAMRRLEGTLDSLGPEQGEECKKHLRSMLPGWLSRLNMGHFWIAEYMCALGDELKHTGNDHASEENTQAEPSE